MARTRPLVPPTHTLAEPTTLAIERHVKADSDSRIYAPPRLRSKDELAQWIRQGWVLATIDDYAEAKLNVRCHPHDQSEMTSGTIAGDQRPKANMAKDLSCSWLERLLCSTSRGELLSSRVVAFFISQIIPQVWVGAFLGLGLRLTTASAPSPLPHPFQAHINVVSHDESSIRGAQESASKGPPSI